MAGADMKFNKNGKFKIMQITDIQEIYNVSPDTLKLLENAVEKEKPVIVSEFGAAAIYGFIQRHGQWISKQCCQNDW